MKKTLKVLALILCFVLMLSGLAFASDPIKVNLNNQQLNFDVNPTVVNGRTLVPLRTIFEALGADIDWNGETKTITATKEDTAIELQVGNKVAKKNGSNITLDTEPTVINGRTLVPVRFISESLGQKVEWDNDTKTVLINSESPIEKYNKNLKVHFIEVGQADSILIQEPSGKSILIDAENNADSDLNTKKPWHLINATASISSNQSLIIYIQKPNLIDSLIQYIRICCI